METMDDYKQELEASFRKISEGDIVKGTVIGVGDEEIILDLQYYAQGVIKVQDYTDDPDFVAKNDVHEGDVIEATVVRLDDGQGNLQLSKKEANEVIAWDGFKRMMEEGTTVTVRIKESVKGGVIAYLSGIRAFIPASQIASDYVEDTDAWIGKEIPVRVITADKGKNKLVLSGKVVAREAEAEERNHRISMMAPGTVLEGTVESIMPYGAFVSLGKGLSGLVHVSQICERRIATPSEVLKVGQKVKVKVLNTKDNKISLSMKGVGEDAADLAEDLDAYTDRESLGTGLGSLLSGIKLG